MTDELEVDGLLADSSEPAISEVAEEKPVAPEEEPAEGAEAEEKGEGEVRETPPRGRPFFWPRYLKLLLLPLVAVCTSDRARVADEGGGRGDHGRQDGAGRCRRQEAHQPVQLQRESVADVQQPPEGEPF